MAGRLTSNVMQEESFNGCKLSGTAKRDLVIQTGMQAIPYVGGSLAALYFGAKQERRFKRLESFYAELAEEVQRISDQIPSVEGQNKIALCASGASASLIFWRGILRLSPNPMIYC
ncbi:MAG: hypothetical protein WA133_09200 [Syntrophales bacterium]